MSSILSNKFLALLLAVIAALVLTLAACGGDDDDDTGDDGPDVTTEDGADEDEGDDDDSDPSDLLDDDGSDDDSDNDEDEVSGDGTDTCSLLTQEEVSEVLGVDVGEGEFSDLDPYFDCSWITGDLKSVHLSVAVGTAGEALFEFNNDDAEEIDGLGDRAQYVGDIFGLLEVLDGDYYLSVSVINSDFDEDEQRDASIELAEIALGRLTD